VREALQLIDGDVRGLTEQARAAESRTGELRHRQKQPEEEERALRARTNRWRELNTVALRLEAALGAGLRTAEELDAAREVLDDERDDLQRRLEGLESAFTEAKERARALDQSGGDFHGDLLTVRDILEGELLVSHFENVDPADAGRMQARLGPLIDAIVVDDARAAAVAIANRERELNTIRPVEEGGLHNLVAPNATGEIDVGPTDVVVEHDGVVRTTRVPLTPTLGRKARERLIAELHALTEDLSGQMSGVGGQLGEIDSRRRDTALLMRDVATLELGDATSDVARVSADLTELSGQIDAQIAAADETRKQADRLSQRSDELRDLLADAYLLDEPDYASKVGKLEVQSSAALLAHTELNRVSQERRTVSERIDALRRPRRTAGAGLGLPPSAAGTKPTWSHRSAQPRAPRRNG
jgi:chromosome partition protein MukB